jgi:glutamine amidotransferase
MKIVIVDYGMGNIHSIVGALTFLGYKNNVISNTRDEIISADRLILPGVGNFGRAIQNISLLGLDKTLEDAQKNNQIPILGICLGMQLLGMSSTESGINKGLEYFNGKVTRFKLDNLTIPHVGFNQVNHGGSMRIFNEIEDGSDFYFTHSYKMLSDQKHSLAYCEYGSNFVCAFESELVAGVQFHPELSQHHGLKLIKNFLELF